MKTHSLAMTLTRPEESSSTDRPTPVPSRRSRASSLRKTSAAIRQALEIAGEALWVLLLFLVIGFVVAKAPQINAAIDQIGGVAATSPTARTMDASREAQIRDLQARFARDESKLVPLEKGFAQLKQRHADLLRAYADLQRARVREATGQAPAGDAKAAAAP